MRAAGSAAGAVFRPRRCRPILLAGLVILLGLLEPGYDGRTEMMSILGGGGGVRRVILDAATALTAGPVGLQRGIAGGEDSEAGPILVRPAGIGLAGSAVL